MKLEERLIEWKAEGRLTPHQCEQLLADSRADAVKPASNIDTLLVVFSGLLNAAMVLSFAWLYDLDVAAHALVLLWMASLAPLVYALRLPALGGLLALYGLVWAPLFTFRHLGVEHFMFRLSTAPVLVLLMGVAVFSFGALHHAWPPFQALARAMRLVGLLASTLALFGLGSPWVAGSSGGVLGLDTPTALAQYATSVMVLAMIAAGLTISAIALRMHLPRVTRMEGPICLGLVATGLVHYMVPLPALVFSLLFTVLMAAMLLVLLSVGMQRKDSAALTLAAVGLWGLTLLRYLDLGWTRLAAGPFFAIGIAGAVVLGGFLTLLGTRALRPAP